jgi:hypothetical protein
MGCFLQALLTWRMRMTGQCASGATEGRAPHGRAGEQLCQVTLLLLLLLLLL